jgi:hypothetical protein
VVLRESPANAMATKLAHHTQALRLGKGLYGMANVAQKMPGRTIMMPRHMAS